MPPIEKNRDGTSRVLVVEDDHGLRRLIIKTLERAGFDVEGVPSGGAAVDLLMAERDAGSWPVLLLDQNLPDMTGGTVVRTLAEQRIKAPFIMMTGQGDERLAVKMMKLGAVDYLVKDTDFLTRLPDVLKRFFSAEDTARRLEEAREALRQSEARHRWLAENMPGFLCTFLPDSTLTYVNPAVVDLVGMSAEALVGRRWVDLLTPENANLFGQALSTLDRSHVLQVVELTHPLPDGSERIVEWNHKAFFDETGQITSLLAVGADITARKQAEAQLEQHSRHLRLILDTVPNYIFAKDIDGQFLLANKAVADVFGVTPEQVVGRTDQDYGASEEQIAAYKQVDRAVVASGRPHFVPEEKILRKDGSMGWFQTIKIPYQQPGWTRPAILGVAVDITERKEMEAERENLQAQLLQARKMEAVGTLAGGVAHDFNNLLQAIGGYTQLMLMGRSAADPDHSRLTIIQRAVDRAAELVQRLLLFSRKTEPHRRLMDLNDEIRQTIVLMQRTLPRMIDIEPDLADDLWTISADPGQMEQVLLNLSSNSADAMPDGGRLRISTRNMMLDKAFARLYPGIHPGPHVVLGVEDNGCGMGPEAVDQVFDPFFTTKDVGKGSGLGLASVYGIVTSHGGSIQCHSVPGQGTTFNIYLPSSGTAPVEVPEEPPSSPFPGGTETVLVVDDEEYLQELMAELLKRLGYRLLRAASGEEALAAYRERGGQIDLVILDLNMPGMGGHQCLQHLLALDPDVRVLVASGYSFEGQGQHAQADGAKGFIGKPWKFGELALKIREVLDA